MVEFIVEFFIFFEHVCYIMPKAFILKSQFDLV